MTTDDYEQAYRDLRAGVEALRDEWMRRYTANEHMVSCPPGAGYYDLLALEVDDMLLASSAPATASECQHGGALVVKFDGGRRSVLCDDCRTVIGYLATASDGATEHRLVGEVGWRSCTCGWEPALGTSIWREFDRHLLAAGVTSSDGDRGLSEDERDSLVDAIGRELYETLMESTGDEWRRWQYLTDAAKERYRAESARIVAEALMPAIERIFAARTAQPEGVERVEWGVRHADGFVGKVPSDEVARRACNNWPTHARTPVRRTVTTYAPVVGEWEVVGDE